MFPTELNIISPDNSMFNRILHIGIVVRSIENTARTMKALFGWNVYNEAITPPGEKLFYGEPEDFSVKMAFFRFNGMEIELLEPLSGRNVWQSFLDERGEGVHHIQFAVSDFEKAKTALEKSGLRMAQCGPSARYKGCTWAYFDAMKELGYYIEIFNPEEFGYEVL